MLIDLASSNDDVDLSADVCILGAGPAGISIAKELVGTNITVVLAESGGFKDDNVALNLYEGHSIGHPVDLTLGRFRIFGGGSTRWAGRSAPLDRLDLEQREWIAASGWPISYDELRSYYDRAKTTCNFRSPWLSTENVVSALKIELPRLETETLVPYVWRIASPDISPSIWSKIALGYRAAFDFGQSYRSLLERDDRVTILLHANFSGCIADAVEGRVQQFTLASLNGRKASVRARCFVICCSGIENARILLNLPAEFLSRINKHDNIGRYFNQHPRGLIGLVNADRRQVLRLQRTFNNFLRPRRVPVQYEVGLALSEQAQRRHEILNASVAFFYEVSDESIWKAGKRVRDALKRRSFYRELLRDVITILVGVPLVGLNVIRRFILGREIIHTRPDIRVVIDLEQEPNRDSRIFVSNDVDALGMRKTVIDWRISEKERKTARLFAEFLDDELAKNELGRLKKLPWLTSDAALQPDNLSGNLHFIGATRMASNEHVGVVDQNCRVFGSQNLYMAGSSVFPTGGHANPMVTIVALAVRLADHLKTQLRKGGGDCVAAAGDTTPPTRELLS